MNIADFRFTHRLRVRWAEVDMQKIVFNPHYLMYVDTAIADYWRRIGLPYESGMALLGGDVFLKKAEVIFHASARLDDALVIGLRCTRVGNSSMAFQAGIFRGEQFLNEVDLVYVYADPATQTAQPVPDVLRQWLLDYEAGRDVTPVHVGDWATLQPLSSPVRQAVFIQEQGIDQREEWDDADATAVHAVVVNPLGQPLATGRLLQDAPGIARIGRMATLSVLRGADFGRKVVNALVQAAVTRGDHTVVLSAQRSAVGFYERLGFAISGPEYEEVGIAHVPMARSLQV